MTSTIQRLSLLRSPTMLLVVCFVIGCVFVMCVAVLNRNDLEADAQSDAVNSETTLTFLKNLHPDTDLPEPSKTGRRFANADLGAGIERILYFGEPWSDGKPLIDEETKYPVEIVEGCAVSRDFVDFIASYNSTMRNHFATTVRAPE